jgi:hypothetical protein
MLEDSGAVENGSIVEVRLVVMVTKVEMSSGPAAGLGLVEIPGIAVDSQDHVAGLESESDGRMGMAIVEELGDVFIGEVSCLALSGCKRVQRDEQSIVNCMCVVQESANNFLDVFDSLNGEGLQEGRGICQLHFDTILNRVVAMRGVLRLSRGLVLELV